MSKYGCCNLGKKTRKFLYAEGSLRNLWLKIYDIPKSNLADICVFFHVQWLLLLL